MSASRTPLPRWWSRRLRSPRVRPPNKIEGKSPWRLGYERLRRDRAAMISVAVIVLIVLVAIFAPVIAAIIGHGPNEQFPAPIGVNAQGQPVGPSTTFWLGTDTSAVTCWCASPTAPGSRSSSASSRPSLRS